MLWHSSFHVHANADNVGHSTLESGRGLLDHVSTDVPLSLERAPLNPRPPAPPSPLPRQDLHHEYGGIEYGGLPVEVAVLIR